MSSVECYWMKQCSRECQERAEHADALLPWIHEAYEKNEELRRADRVDQFDLFSSVPSAEVVELWEGIHRALGEEYRRRSRLFWGSCPTFGEAGRG